MNIRNKILLLTTFSTFSFPGGLVLSAEQIYGSQLMTQQERMEHRTKMQSMKTKEERERYRMEHHKLMQQRAKQRGVTLPDKPQMRNKGMDGGSGMGGGMGGGRGR